MPSDQRPNSSETQETTDRPFLIPQPVFELEAQFDRPTVMTEG